jgi:hypothetical protein
MRTLLSLMALLGFVAVAPAQEPPRPRTDKDPAYAPMPPEVVLAMAVGDKGEIHVDVRVTKYVTYTESVEVIKKVDGKDVKSVVPVTKTRSVSIMEAKKFDLAKEGTSVITADGKPLKLEDAIKRLEKKTPILISFGGPPDPFHLQTTKPDTLILIMPAPQLGVPAVPGGPMPPKVAPTPLKP